MDIHGTGTYVEVYNKNFPWKSTIHVGKYTNPMDPIGKGLLTFMFPGYSKGFEFIFMIQFSLGF